MRPGISIKVSHSDQRRLETLVRDRNAAQKHVWRAEIVLLSAAGLGTVEIMRRTAKSKTCVWRWQERFAAEGVEVSMRDVVDVVVANAAQRWGKGQPIDRADVAWRVPVADLAPFTRGEGAGTPVGRRGIGFGGQADGTSVRQIGRAHV